MVGACIHYWTGKGWLAYLWVSCSAKTFLESVSGDDGRQRWYAYLFVWSRNIRPLMYPEISSFFARNIDMMVTKYILRALRRRISYEKLKDRYAICQEISRVFGVAEMDFDWAHSRLQHRAVFTITKNQTSQRRDKN